MTHQRGSLSVEERLGSLRTLTLPADTTLALGESQIAQFGFECHSDLALLPASLHPSIPAHITILAWRCPESPFGPSNVVQVRVGCRAGLLPRAFVTATLVDNPALLEVLAEGWAFAPRLADIEFTTRYERAELRAAIDGEEILAVAALDLRAIPTGSITIAPSLNLARLGGEGALVQVEHRYNVEEPELGRPMLATFDSAALSDGRLRPLGPIAGSVARGTVELLPTRYILSTEPDREPTTIGL